MDTQSWESLNNDIINEAKIIEKKKPIKEEKKVIKKEAKK